MSRALACTSATTTGCWLLWKVCSDLGNSVLVVEHDADTIRVRADYVLDPRPRRGRARKGELVAHCGTVADIEANPRSLTGINISKATLKIAVPKTRVKASTRARVAGNTGSVGQ